MSAPEQIPLSQSGGSTDSAPVQTPFSHLGDPAPGPQSQAARAGEMVRRGRFATQVAIVFTLIVLIGLPVLAGLPQIAMTGGVILVILLLMVRLSEHHPGAYAVCLQSVYAVALGGTAYAVFVVGLDPAATVYFPPIVVLGCAYILGWRAAVFWTLPCLAVMASAVYLPIPAPVQVDHNLDFVARAGGLLTVLAFAVSFRRSHDRQAAELAHLAGTDSLTGLANRLGLMGAIETALARAARFERGSALVFIDLDGMKKVNDAYGHDFGDRYLRAIAARIEGMSRNFDTLARLGGDEFVVLLSETTSAEGAQTYAEKLMDVLAQPLEVSGVELRPRASLGFACFPEHGDNAITLLDAADAAMYAAKQDGGSRVHAPSLQRAEQASVIG